ncbi:helix-turn-helix transcriptional regulator [Caldichromatium japonicum]|uniref:Helix-turn-helix transcriptional regulator n=1 Tax=Caldichromatium japonicum TaxID=2699430 RepID=A0A6G7VE04_9GAMM|nr:helix-turn-helix transcriptional regulator [Caldichromatium japonicum]QIK38096.1 helix-turn-helix transcriptional regulator [Caldichromatium japonicum]
MKTRTPDALERRLLADPLVRQAFDELAPQYAVARVLIEARARAGLSQAELARRMGTTQSVIARLESGRTAPSLRTLQRYAESVGGRLTVKIEA